MPRGQHLYPSTSLAVLTASPAAHILASDLSLHSTLLATPSLTAEHLASAGRGHDSESEDESTFGPAHKRTARTQAGLPLTAWYLHPGVADANRDPAAALDVLTTGTNAAAPAEQPSSPTVGAWYFLKDLTEKMARTSLTATI
ncbi:hypothetical protein BC828DRAFT_8945 [Blastocladiella britannica]|nr:hypothetical protein BC828DRAFT_8945 [Blastocladiella britannica]